MIERRTINSRAEWLEWRKNDITASSIGALFDEHPYTTALRQYVEKRGVEFPELDPEDKVLRRGRWLEPAVGKAVSERRPEWRIEQPNLYLRDPILRLGATPDFFIRNDARGLGVLQTKTASPDVYRRDWEDGAAVPMWIVLQAATEMMLAEAAFGAVAVLLVDAFNMDVAIHELPRNPSAEHKIRVAVKQFWDSVAIGQEPQPDFARDAETIRAMLPKEQQGKVIDLSGNNVLPTLLDERAALCDAIKEAEARREAIDAELKFTLGDAEFATGLDGWRITFKSTEYRGYTVAPRTSRTLRVFDKRERAS
jgi:predicted phage-related endonuclease